MRTELFLALVLAAAAPVACSSSSSDSTDATTTNPDAEGTADSGVRLDAAAADASNPDAAPVDAAAPDAGPADSSAIDVGPRPDASAPDVGTRPDASPSDSGVPGTFTLTSDAFMNGMMIPTRNTCRGTPRDVQPQLGWINPPAGTMSFAIVLIDDTINFVHWIAYNIPATTTNLPESASNNHMLPMGTTEVLAYCPRTYCGPCPGSTHTYTFRLYALSAAMVTVPARPDRTYRDADLQAAFGPSMLGRANLTGTFP